MNKPSKCRGIRLSIRAILLVALVVQGSRVLADEPPVIQELRAAGNIFKTYFDNGSREIEKVSRESDIGGLEFSKVKDLSPLKKYARDLTRLRRVSMSGTTSSMPIPGGTSHSTHYIEANLSLLADLPELHEVFLTLYSGDLSPLAELTKLRSLFIYDSRFNDFSPLEKLTNLKSLSIVNTTVDHIAFSDLSLLANMTKLEQLSLNRTYVSELTPLAKLTSLIILHIDSTKVTDLSPLANLTELHSFSFADTSVNDLSPLSKLTKLHELDLRGARKSSDLKPLANLTSLEYLHLDRTKVHDISPLIVQQPVCKSGNFVKAG